jgi:hypothetical protein
LHLSVRATAIKANVGTKHSRNPSRMISSRLVLIFYEVVEVYLRLNHQSRTIACARLTDVGLLCGGAPRDLVHFLELEGRPEKVWRLGP